MTRPAINAVIYAGASLLFLALCWQTGSFIWALGAALYAFIAGICAVPESMIRHRP